MIRSKILVIFLILQSINSYSQDIIPIHKGDTAPFEGLLFPRDKAVELKNGLLERDAFKSLNDSLNNSLNFQTDIINKKNDAIKICLDQNDRLAKTSYDSQSMNDWVKFMYFGLGIATTGLVFYGLRSATK